MVPRVNNVQFLPNMALDMAFSRKDLITTTAHIPKPYNNIIQLSSPN